MYAAGDDFVSLVLPDPGETTLRDRCAMVRGCPTGGHSDLAK
jgi:hypothetical protein